MFFRKSVWMSLTAAIAAASIAQTQPPPATPPAAVPLTGSVVGAQPAAPKTTEVEGGTPAWIKAETPEHRHDRLGTEDPGPNPDPSKVFFRYGKQYHIERFEKRWANYEGQEEGMVRPYGFLNVSKEIYQQNDKYVWVWFENKPGADPNDPVVPEKPAPRYTEPQMKYLRYIRPEFQELATEKSSKTIRFVESSEGLPKTGSWRNSLDVGDMNGDGFPDLLVPPMRGAGGMNAVPLIYLGDGKGHWKLWETVVWPYSVQYGSAAVADFNQDGKMDAAFGVHLNGIRAMLGDGKGNFVDASEGLPVDDYPTRRILVTDVDQDGYPDIVAISEGVTAVPRAVKMGKMVAFLNRDKGTRWEAHDIADVSNLFGADWMATGKFNQDQYPDFAGGSIFFQASQLLFRSRGKAKWDVVKSEGVVVPYLSYYLGMTAGHFRTASQLDDLIMSYARFWPTDVANELPDPPATKIIGIDRITFDGAEPKRIPITRWSSGRGIWGLAQGDLDGDGKLDFAFTRFDPRELDILLGDGKGGFALAKTEGLTIEPNTNYDLKITDVNGDGRPDIVIMYESHSTTRLGEQDGSIRVFLNLGVSTAGH